MNDIYNLICLEGYSKEKEYRDDFCAVRSKFHLYVI